MSIRKESPFLVTNAIGTAAWEGLALGMGEPWWFKSSGNFTSAFLTAIFDTAFTAATGNYPTVTATAATQTYLDPVVKVGGLAAIGPIGINLSPVTSNSTLLARVPIAGPGWIAPVKAAVNSIVASQPIGDLNAGGLVQAVASVVTKVGLVLGTSVSANVGDGSNFYNYCLVKPL